MGFLARSRDRLLLPRRLARWRAAPSPAALNDAVQPLLRLGDVERAWAIARQGYARFKSDPLVREIYRIAGRAHAEHGVVAAREEVRSHPSAAAFLKLARFSVLLRDAAAAFAALEECLRRFPNSAAAHAALAELLEQRWLRDLAASDARTALSHLRKAWRLDGSQPQRPLRLAALLARIGAVRESLAVVDDVLALHEGDPDALRLRESLAAVVAAREEAGSLAPDREEDVDGLLRQIEESGRVVGDAGDAARVARESDRLRAFLPALRDRTACEKAIVVEPKGAVLDERGTLGASPLASLAANLARSAQCTVRRLELGPLHAVALETAGGTLLLRRGQRCLAGVLVDRPEALGEARGGLEDLVAGRLPAAPVATALAGGAKDEP